MGCAFCASTVGGKIRNLTAGELLDQVIFTQKDSGAPISNIVLMGIGEPLDNYANVLKIPHPGQPPRRNEHRHAPHLALYLRPDQRASTGWRRRIYSSRCPFPSTPPTTRPAASLMPVNRAAGVDALLAACRRYFQNTGRRISYEYAMIDGVNDYDSPGRPAGRPAEGTARPM